MMLHLRRPIPKGTPLPGIALQDCPGHAKPPGAAWAEASEVARAKAAWDGGAPWACLGPRPPDCASQAADSMTDATAILPRTAVAGPANSVSTPGRSKHATMHREADLRSAALAPELPR
mmetsp:Transcript_14274/g.42500  ORF Transcript_14274/g.42500 Transcript_14274/m.42500 type:complete len:119 (+) Transcript_14274:195-551(+)